MIFGEKCKLRHAIFIIVTLFVVQCSEDKPTTSPSSSFPPIGETWTYRE